MSASAWPPRPPSAGDPDLPPPLPPEATRSERASPARAPAASSGRPGAAAAPASGAPFGWWREITLDQRRALWAAGAGWMLDACDVMLYAFALAAIREDLGLSAGAAGALASATLLAAALGGVVVGALADRFGRVRMLQVSILLYSLGTALCATASTVWELALWRAVVGLGLAGEWATGSVLVAETWPAAHRGKGIGLMQAGWAVGTLAAALLAALVLPAWGWRPLFLLGALPALLVVWIRRRVTEPPSWQARRGAALRDAAGETGAPGSTARAAAWRQLLEPPYAGRMVVATLLTTALLWSYWGLFTWLPAFLASSGEGGVGLGMTRSLAWIVPLQIGAFVGYVAFGVLADRFGRRPVFVTFALAAAALVPAYVAAAREPWLLLLASPLLGCFGHGYWSVLGALLAELFPAEARATAQGFCYNAGRAVAAAAPGVVGTLAAGWGLGPALVVSAVGFLVAAGLIYLLPETRGQELA